MWPNEYIELKHIEDLLLCGICYEYMETSVMTSCSHNYCSLCIRKYLHYKTQCPACFAETFEKDLRKNKVLDDVIILFLKIKDKLKRCLQIQIQFMQSGKGDITLNSPKATSVDKEEHLSQQVNKIVSKNIHTKVTASPSTNVQKDLSSPSTSGRARIPLMFTPKSIKRPIATNTEDTKVVICPVCKVTVSELHINKHLDDCLKRETMKDRPETVESKRKPLPKLVFSLMKDAVLKKKLKETGLSSQGDRRAMEARLQRYIVLYNAECDKLNPRPISELLKQCEDEENLEKKINKTSSLIYKLQVNRNTEQNVIDDERRKYLETYKDSFESLIRKIKNTSSSKKPSVRRNLLNESMENDEQISQKAVAGSSDESMNDNDNSVSANSRVYILDSDSDTSCPLQMYSSTDPKKFLNIELSASKDSVPGNQCGIIKMENTDGNSDALNAISVTSKEMFPIMDAVVEKSTAETNPRKPSNGSKYTTLLQRNEKFFLKDERMDSVSNGKKDSDPNNASDQEEMRDEKSSSVLQDILYDLSSNDSIDRKPNSADHGFLNNSILNSTNWEKENVSSSPEHSGKRSLRKRSREFAHNDKIVPSTKKKIKKSPQCYVSETDESNSEESQSAVNDSERKGLQSKSRVRRQILNTSMAEGVTGLRKSARTRFKNNILQKER